MTTTRKILTGKSTILEFLMAGKAIVTLENTAKNTRLTFRVEKVKGTPNYNVYGFTGSDNALKSSYTLLGEIKGGALVATSRTALIPDLIAWADAEKDAWVAKFAKNCLRYYTNGWKLSAKMEKVLVKYLKKAKIPYKILEPTDLKSRSFKWFWETLNGTKTLPAILLVWHEGMCCQCASRLTVPASIETGYGPVCAKNLGGNLWLTWKALNKSRPAA